MENRFFPKHIDNSTVPRRVGSSLTLWLAIILVAGVVASFFFGIAALEHFSAIANNAIDDRSTYYSLLGLTIAGPTVLGVVYDLFFRRRRAGKSLVEKSRSGSHAARLSVFLLSLFLSEKEKDAIVGDLLEEYDETRSTAGSMRAILWLVAQVLASVWPMVRKAIGQKLPFGAKR